MVARADALLASEARYQDLFENGSDLIQSVAPDGSILFVNRAWRETLAFDESEIVGRSVFDFIAAGSIEHCKTMFGRIMAGEDVDAFNVEMVASDGRIVALEGRVSLRMKDGKLDSTRAIFRDVTARRDVERKLVENELLLDSIIENLPAMVFVKRASDLRFERFNRAGEELAQRSRDAIIGRTDYELHPKEVADAYAAADRKALATDGVIEIQEQPHRSFTGEERVLRTSKVALRDASGAPTHVLGVAVDISSQKRAEEQLRRLNAELEQRVNERTAALAASERFARSTIDALETEVAVLDAEGMIIATNAAWKQFFATSGVFDLDVAENDNYLQACERACEVWPSTSARQIADGVRDVLTGRRERLLIEYPITVADGEHWFMCRVTRLVKAEPIYVIVTYDDVTEVHRARDEAAAGAQVFASLERLSPVGIFHCDPNGINRSVNRRWGEITGQTLQESIELGWHNAVHPEDRARVTEAFAETNRSRAPLMYECRYLHRDGKVVWVIGQAAEVTDSSGALTGYVGTLTDVTQRRLLEAQLAQAVKMEAIGKLTGGMAHDFNNYLGIIVGNLDLLQEQPFDNPAATRLIEAALRGALRAADLTKSLLAFSRRQPLDPKVTNVGESLRVAVGLMRRSLGADIKLIVRLADDVWPVRIDNAQLDSSVINLVTNARDAMPDGGTLTLACRNAHLDAGSAAAAVDAPAGDYVVIEVADTGTGVAEGDLQRVFEPFFTTKKIGHGTGLGLSMVYGFVKQSGGHVHIDSRVGSGTTVGIYLPRDSQTVSAADLGDEHVDTATATGSETILVVEDNDQVRATACAQLESLGYHVLEADCAASALAALDQGSSPDLLFTDIVMPGEINGYTLAAMVAERRPGIAILLTSGFPGEARGSEGAALESADLLGKPYRKIDLARAIRSALDATGARRPQLAPDLHNGKGHDAPADDR